jgi:hypothetical protein
MCPLACKIRLGLVKAQQLAKVAIRFQRRPNVLSLPLCLHWVDELSQLLNLALRIYLTRSVTAETSVRERYFRRSLHLHDDEEEAFVGDRPLLVKGSR